MSYEILVKTALKKQEIFKNLKKYLEVIKETVHKLDPEAEIFMFGSLIEKRYNYSSDIDILIITRLHPANIHFELWKAGIRDPFEIHVHSPEKAIFFKMRTNLVKV
jgi:predicted nucleotidyltransferase